MKKLFITFVLALVAMTSFGVEWKTYSFINPQFTSIQASNAAAAPRRGLTNLLHEPTGLPTNTVGVVYTNSSGLLAISGTTNATYPTWTQVAIRDRYNWFQDVPLPAIQLGTTHPGSGATNMVTNVVGRIFIKTKPGAGTAGVLTLRFVPVDANGVAANTDTAFTVTLTPTASTTETRSFPVFQGFVAGAAKLRLLDVSSAATAADTAVWLLNLGFTGAYE